jgi:hypothetical protein
MDADIMRRDYQQGAALMMTLILYLKRMYCTVDELDHYEIDEDAEGNKSHVFCRSFHRLSLAFSGAICLAFFGTALGLTIWPS